jgi:hypothetical protein
MAIRLVVMFDWGPIWRVPMVFFLDEKRPELEGNHSLSSGAREEMSGSAHLHTKWRTKLKYKDEGN